MRKTLSKEKTM